MSFVHLVLHTEYSIIDGLVRIKPLIKTLQDTGMPACAVTDQNNLFALVKFYTAAQAAGIKPILGSDVLVREADGSVHRLILLCQNHAGYLNLSRLISRAYQEGQKLGVPAIQMAWLHTWNTGLIVLSGGIQGNIGQALFAGNMDRAVSHLDQWTNLFPDRFYLQLQRTGRTGEEAHIQAAVNLALEKHLPVVATNDVRFLQKTDYAAHNVRVCIHDGYTIDDSRHVKKDSENQYLRTADEMVSLFTDLPEAIENTELIAQRCTLNLTLWKNFLPQFPTGKLSTETFFRVESKKGLEARLVFLYGDAETIAAKRTPYDERLQIELDVIVGMDFSGYFLIVADFIQWSKQHDIPVGPGRGSGAGSLVAYALGITDLDPLEYDLFFERFLNPERVSMPDFDIDFCMDGRDRVIDYVARRYGRDKVSQIITYGSMAAKAVIRDVGRVLSHPYGFIDQIAKMIPFEIGMSLTKALKQEKSLQARYDEEEEVRSLIDMALQLEGLTRNAGKHAGGVVIAPTALTDFSPLYCEEGESSIVTQFDKNDVEAVGLVKFDFLGLRTLTIIDWALRNIQTVQAAAGNPGDKMNILDIPLDDTDVYELLTAGHTVAIFQLESRGMQEMIKRLKPNTFEDIIALVALYRPGPLQSGMVDDFINRKQGVAKIEYPHPDLEEALKPTYGVILYQEQVMQIAQILADYTLGGADMLRRAMGKKKPEEMAKQRSIFMAGSDKKGVKSETATYIFDLMEKFAAYGFNKSHSAAYALISYQTAWLKVHYPAAFIAAALSADMDNTDKVVLLIEEARRMKLTLLPPSVNDSQIKFSVCLERDKTLYYGLGAIKGAGEAALEGIIEARQTGENYQDLFDFCRRVDLRKCNRRVLDSLIRAGALDCFQQDREVLLASLPLALKMAEQDAATQASGQNDLFGLPDAPKDTSPDKPYVTEGIEIWTEAQRLIGEKETLGLYLSGHPIVYYLPELARFAQRLNSVSAAKGKKIIVAGLVHETRMRTTGRGKMAFLTLDDQSSRLEVKMFSKVLEAHQDLLVKDSILVIEGEVGEDSYNGGLSMNAQNIMDIPTARARFAHYLRLELNASDEAKINQIEHIISPYRQAGACPVIVHYQNAAGLKARLRFADNWHVQLEDTLLAQLSHSLGKDRCTLVFKRDTQIHDA